MENNIIPPKIKHTITILSRPPMSGYTPKRTDSGSLNRYLYTHVHSSIIRHSQQAEATPVSNKRWMDKQNAVETYDETWFSLKKEGNSNNCNKTDETRAIMLSEIS